jgi:hypothetical protein
VFGSTRFAATFEKSYAMNMPDRIGISPKEPDALLQRVKTGRLEENDYAIIKAMAVCGELFEPAVRFDDTYGIQTKRLKAG